MFRFVLFTAFLPLLSFADVHKEEENCLSDKRNYRATVRHIESGGIGYEDGYTTLEAFFSSDPNQWKITPFLDARGHVFDNGKWAANVGVGLRTLWGNRVYGINTYYDYRNTNRLSSNQIGAGLETLGEVFDFRINGYLPVGAKISGPYDAVFESFTDNYMLVSQKIHSAMKGSDAEFGFHFGKTESFDFYAAAGPYYFTGEVDHPTWGGKARISGSFNDILTLEISDSYDGTFHNKFQGQISLGFSFGSKSKVKAQKHTCKVSNTLTSRMLQPVGRQEIIVIDKTRKNTVAIDPTTGSPYFFVFVDNTSSSDGTYKSPYHTLVQAQENSSPNDIIYVFPGDGTTTGMDSGITLQANQKFWGSGVSHTLQTSQGAIAIPQLSPTLPTITNTNIDTEGNAITLAANNDISGFIINGATNDGIYGIDLQSLDVSACIFENTITYPIEAIFSSDASISISNNQFLNNTNGIALTLNGTSTVACLNNSFEDQTSVSSIPLEIIANSNTFVAQIKNNFFNNNNTGSIRFDLNHVVGAAITILDNTITNNSTGSQSSLGSSIVLLPTGTTDSCSIVVRNNSFSGNTSNALYLHTSGAFSTLDITASANTISNIGGSALVLATPGDTLRILATDNTITDCNDNGIAIISSSTSTIGTITISNNTITNIGNASNGIAINQNFSNLNLTIQENEINNCQGTGILSYAPTGIDSLIMNISDNAINNCENLSSNAASGLDIEQYTALAGSIINNTLMGNTSTAVVIGSTLPTPSACLTLTGNNNGNEYLLSNPGDGLFNLSPCNVDSVNSGTINTSGTITLVQSCPEGAICP